MTVNTKRIAEFAKNNKPASASVLIFVVVFILLMAMNLSNIIDFARTYDEAVNLPSYADRNAYFAYDDILCQDMFCVEMEGMNEADATEYFNKSIPAIRERYKGFFISSSIIYTFIALLFGQYFMVKKNESCARKHYRDVLLGGVICWAVYIGIVFAVLLAKGFVMSLRTPRSASCYAVCFGCVCVDHTPCQIQNGRGFATYCFVCCVLFRRYSFGDPSFLSQNSGVL